MFEIPQLATAIDCEGYLGINKLHIRPGKMKTACYSARIGLGMNHPAIPYALKDRFGSTIRLEPQKTGRFPIYRWTAVGNKLVRPILETLLPYLVVKKPQAEHLIAFIDYVNLTRSHGKIRTDAHVLENFFIQAKALNQAAPATTERETPATGCDSLNLQETARDEAEAPYPPVQ